jgi:hypothetical protein
MLKNEVTVNQPLRNKLEAWRAQKAADAPAAGGANTVIAKEVPQHQKPTAGTWYRSVPTARRNNLIMKSHGDGTTTAKTSSQNGKMFPKKDKENMESNENQSTNKPILKVLPAKEVEKEKEEEVSPTEKDLASEKEIKRLQDENKQLSAKFKAAVAAANEATTRGIVAMQEVISVGFLNDVLEQKNLELDCKISSERMTVNENASDKSRKHKQEIEKLKKEKNSMATRTDEMILQLNEQMAQLQTFAMDRIAVSHSIYVFFNYIIKLTYYMMMYACRIWNNK